MPLSRNHLWLTIRGKTSIVLVFPVNAAIRPVNSGLSTVALCAKVDFGNMPAHAQLAKELSKLVDRASPMGTARGCIGCWTATGRPENAPQPHDGEAWARGDRDLLERAVPRLLDRRRL